MVWADRQGAAFWHRPPARVSLESSERGQITGEHLYTAVSIYLLLGITWFALYNAIDILTPGSIVRSSGVITDRSTELLYFSLVTLSTVGYGDIVPVHPEVRMLAVLESIVGVLYIAIMVAILVSAYKRPIDSR